MEHHGPTSWLLRLPLLPHDEKFIHVNGAVVVTAVVTLVSVLAYLKLKKDMNSAIIPKKSGLVTVIDWVIETLYGMIQGTLGPDTRNYFPFVASLFIFIFVSNVLGLLPLSDSPTANCNTTYAIGIATYIYYNAMGIRSHGLKAYLAHFLMGFGAAGIVFFFLEMISHGIRPISLGVRLLLNIKIDHIVAHSFQNLVAWIVPVPLLLFGLLVCTIQAFVFATLTAVYIQLATEHEHEHAHESH